MLFALECYRFYSEPAVPPPRYPNTEYSPNRSVGFTRTDPEDDKPEAPRTKKTWHEAGLYAVAGLAIILVLAMIVLIVFLVRELDDEREKGM